LTVAEKGVYSSYPLPILLAVERPQGRIGVDSGCHCAHEQMDFFYWVTDWEPLHYFSTRASDPFHEGISERETYELIPNAEGTEVRYTPGPAFDEEGDIHPGMEKQVADVLAGFWPFAFGNLVEMLKTQ
jgi:hypothetical protein